MVTGLSLVEADATAVLIYIPHGQNQKSGFMYYLSYSLPAAHDAK